MIARASMVTIAISLALSSAGCKRAGTAASLAAPVPVTDYRTLNQGAIEVLIADKTGCPVKLKPAGPNKYTGTREAPGETVPVPVTVTVGEKRIIVQTHGGGLTSTQVITERGVEKDIIH